MLLPHTFGEYLPKPYQLLGVDATTFTVSTCDAEIAIHDGRITKSTYNGTGTFLKEGDGLLPSAVGFGEIIRH